MIGKTRLKFLPALWVGIIFLAAQALPQTQPADLKGKLENVKNEYPVEFTLIESTNKWLCLGGSPTAMKDGGWDWNRLRGAKVTIRPAASIQDGRFSVKTVTTSIGLTLPGRPGRAGTTAPEVKCTLQSGAKK